MNTKPDVARQVSLLTFAIFLAAALPTCGQPAVAGTTESRPAPPRGGTFQDRNVNVMPREDIGSYRVLTEEQRRSFREAMEAQRDQTRALEEKLRKVRKEVVVAGLTEKFDENAVRTKALEVGKLEAELAVLRARALSQVKPPLSADQIEQIKNPPPFKPGESRLRTVDGQLRALPMHQLRSPPVGARDEHDLPAAPKPEK